MAPHGGLCDICFGALEPNVRPCCSICDEPNSDILAGAAAPALPGAVCKNCQTRRPAFSRLRAPYLFGGSLARVIKDSKFRGRSENAAALAELMYSQDEGVAAILAVTDVLVPVPLSTRRLCKRGFNQSLLIARRLARLRGVPVVDALKRTRHTRAQSELTKGERAKNVTGAFSPRHSGRLVSGLRVTLVDDVVTSGETARAAAAALHKLTPAAITVVAAARATADLRL